MEVTLSNMPVIDWELGTKLAGNKKDLAKDMLNLLVKDLPTDLPTINKLHKNENYQELQKHIHRLHGALCYCGTPRVKSIVSKLETDLKNNIMDSLPSLLKQLNTEVNLLLEHHSLL